MGAILLTVETTSAEGTSISPYIIPILTLNAEPNVVSLGEEFTLRGKLSISRESGDINQDGIVDIRDISIVGRAYGSYPGHPKWNPDADLNGDGIVDIRDIAIVARNFAQTAAAKPIEIQQLIGDSWVKIADLTTSNDGSFELTLSAPEVTGTLYFRAYFPGGEY